MRSTQQKTPTEQLFLKFDVTHIHSLWFKGLRGEVWQYSSNVMCFLNGLFLGNEKDLTSWAKSEWGFGLAQPQSFYESVAEDYYAKHLQKTGASQIT